MPRIYSLGEIESVLPELDLVAAMEQGFAAYSRGDVVVGPVGELVFREPPGDVHLKYGYRTDDTIYVVKIASGFYDNPSRGLPSSDGVMLVFDRSTGEMRAVLLDRGRLTDERTAAAGAVAAKHLSPPRVCCLGILGAGTQARRQLDWIGRITGCSRAAVWARRSEAAAEFAAAARDRGFEVTVHSTPREVAQRSEVMVTTTPATSPLLRHGDLRAGTLVVAVGADAAGKQELDARILGEADLVVADSRDQCRRRGEIAAALAAGCIVEEELIELGEIVAGTTPVEVPADAIVVADLTGVAIQDIQIARAVVDGLAGREVAVPA